MPNITKSLLLTSLVLVLMLLLFAPQIVHAAFCIAECDDGSWCQYSGSDIECGCDMSKPEGQWATCEGL